MTLLQLEQARDKVRKDLEMHLKRPSRSMDLTDEQLDDAIYLLNALIDGRYKHGSAL